MASNSTFFDAVRSHSEVKHRILGKFIPPWRAKLGYKVRLRGADSLWYVDAFAGVGKYGDGKHGSPLIAAEQAASALRENRDYRLHCINVERSSSRFSRLVQNTDPWIQGGADITNLLGGFAEMVPDVQRIVGDDDPLLLFIDPFGIKGLDLNALRGLLNRPGELDLMLTFNTRAIARLVKDYPDFVTNAVGTSEWMKDWPTQGSEVVVRLLKENLVKEGGFLDVVSYDIRGVKEEPAHYQLLLASRHEDAYELVNDSICQEESLLEEKYFRELSQSSFLLDLDEADEARALVDAITDFARQAAETNRREIVRHLLFSNWGRWHSKNIRKAVSALTKEGRFNRVKVEGGDIDTDPLEFVH
jgi:three-Cys-motif partner protein